MRIVRSTVALGLAAAAVTVGLVAGAHAEDETTSFTIDDAQVRWGFNVESNSRAFAPGTYNLFSAGTIPNPGHGGVAIKPADWRASDGQVRIEKRRPDGGYARATYSGTQTDVNGAPLGSAGSGSNSGHQVVVGGGEGTVDPEAGTADIRWRGTFTVLYYSGYTYFTVTDPRLVVTATSARLLGTLGGFETDRNDPDQWVPLPPTQATLATIPRAGLELPDEGGFNATPAYRAVRFDAPSGGTEQVRSGPDWGSFPKTYVDFMVRAGAAPYWYSSGGAADAHKVALPITVSYSAGDPVKPPTPPEPTPGPGTPTQPEVPERPDPSDDPQPSSPAPTQPAAPSAPPVVEQVSTGSTPDVVETTPPATTIAAPIQQAPPVVYALTSSAPRPGNPDSDHRWQWWLGSLLLLGAAALTTFSSLLKGRR